MKKCRNSFFSRPNRTRVSTQKWKEWLFKWRRTNLIHWQVTVDWLNKNEIRKNGKKIFERETFSFEWYRIFHSRKVQSMIGKKIKNNTSSSVYLFFRSDQYLLKKFFCQEEKLSSVCVPLLWREGRLYQNPVTKQSWSYGRSIDNDHVEMQRECQVRDMFIYQMFLFFITEIIEFFFLIWFFFCVYISFC